MPRLAHVSMKCLEGVCVDVKVLSLTASRGVS